MSEHFGQAAVRIRLDGAGQSSAWSDGRNAASYGNASQTLMVICQQDQKIWLQCINSDGCEVHDNSNLYKTFSATLVAMI